MTIERHSKNEYYLSIDLINSIVKVRAQINREQGSAKIQAFNPLTKKYHRTVIRSLSNFSPNEYQAISWLMISAKQLVTRMGLVELL